MRHDDKTPDGEEIPRRLRGAWSSSRRPTSIRQLDSGLLGARSGEKIKLADKALT